MKFSVGLMLATFGTFWAGEGVGIEWPLGDAVLLVLLAVYVAASVAAVWLVRKRIGAMQTMSRAAAGAGS